QALRTIDFPRTIRRAYDDGVRIFIEHGPRSQCTQSIKSILGGRPHLAVALDTASRSSLKQAMYAAAELWAAGVSMELPRFPDVRAREGTLLPAHPPHAFVMSPAPILEPLLTASLATSPMEEVFARVAETHQFHLQQMTRLDQTYQELQG